MFSSFQITLIFHGADVFDYEDARWLIRDLNPARSIVAGVMGRTAAAESGLPVFYDGRKPSDILEEYSSQKAILVHRAKNSTSAQRFGSIIASRLASHALLFIEPAARQILIWGRKEDMLTVWLSEQTGFLFQAGEPHKIYPPGVRCIGGCLPGEPVFVNGVIIGYATAEEAVIELQGGQIVGISGIEMKDHGVEKLMRTGFRDLVTAWCKSGYIRNTYPKTGNRGMKRGMIGVIDHVATSCYEYLRPDICGLLTIGDDTTSICGHIGCFKGIPVLGITDGDLDGIIPEGCAEGSVILQATHERDDDLGKEILHLIPEIPVEWDTWVKEVIRYLGDRVIVVQKKPKKSF
jgi:hypothetical protein